MWQGGGAPAGACGRGTTLKSVQMILPEVVPTRGTACHDGIQQRAGPRAGQNLGHQTCRHPTHMQNIVPFRAAAASQTL
jgi:hypothetical protein